MNDRTVEVVLKIKPPGWGMGGSASLSVAEAQAAESIRFWGLDETVFKDTARIQGQRWRFSDGNELNRKLVELKLSEAQIGTLHDHLELKLSRSAR
ncbi:MAG: hypothetical protein ACYCWW_16540 [Deltaproteobacteria bacterium]